MTADRMPWDEAEPMPAEPDIDPAEPTADVETDPAPSSDLRLIDAVELADLLNVRDPAAIANGVGMIRDELTAAVDKLATDGRAARTAEITHPTDLRAEATRLADAYDVLRGIGGAFNCAADRAAERAAELVDDVPARINGEGDAVRVKSIKVGDGHGSDLVVKREQRRELSVDFDAVVDVIVAMQGATEITAQSPAVAYVQGVRAGITALRELLSTSPSFRSTALDVQVRALEEAELDALAKRLAKAYARVDKGDPVAKLERVAPAKSRSSR